MSRFHDERKTKLSLILDNERWKQADVPADFQDLVNHISASGELKAPERGLAADRAPTEYLLVDRDKYAVVGYVVIVVIVIAIHVTSTCSCGCKGKESAPKMG